ncbi:f-box only protein 48-related [Holotrichia oblita]|uniref:F-box only protein 48-related n=1 Tax=Holotrichia oblita TaxID=644536 RepID=A0ACB9SYM2_HOLOL|nr:f-box only protein 48-related [Holotrichia oblita]
MNEGGESSLANFRQEWQKELQELKHRKANIVTTPIRNVRESQVIEDDSDEIKAKKLFMKGIEMERSKKMYEAIQFYRRAVQLVPDIEFKLEDSFKNKVRIDNEEDNHDYTKITKGDEDCTDDMDSDDEIDESTFLQRIERKVNKNNLLCIPKVEQKGMHISELPTEILLYILRWVVSSDLDLRSLEMFAQSCRGFYLCARDQKIWRLACERAWGLNCGTLMGEYSSWREMFLERARLHFNGCYISKTTYIRQGESSFQDQFYRPWHVVTFYRYFR